MRAARACQLVYYINESINPCSRTN